MSAKQLTAKAKQLKKDVENFGKKGKAITLAYVQTRLNLLEDLWCFVSKIYDAFLEEDDEVIKGQPDVESLYDEIREDYCVLQARLLDSLESFHASTSQQCNLVTENETTNRNDELHLPAIKIPTFDGSYENWPNFHDLFVTLVGTKLSLSDIQKMHYLKTSLAGDAEKLLLAMKIQGHNYVKAWSIPKDHPRVLVNMQLNTLFNLPSLIQERAESIKDLLYTSTPVIHSLANLKIEVEHLDPVLIFLLVRKLPSRTQQMWEEKLNDREDPKKLPTFKEFTSFLETRFRTLEAVDQQHSQGTSKPPRDSSHKNSFIAHAQYDKSKLSCKICQKNKHVVRRYSKFLKMSVSERSQVINKLGLCRNCLGYNHVTDSCPTSRRCYHCQQSHHTLLHANNSLQPSQQPSRVQLNNNSFQQVQPTNSSQSNNQVQQQNGIQNLQSTILNVQAPSFQSANKPSGSNNLTSHHSHHSSPTKNSQVLLATALVKVRSSLGEWLTLRALLDTGFEASFITEYAAQLLQLKSRTTHTGVSELGLVSSGTCLRVVDITFASQHSFATSTQAYILKSLCGHLPARTLHVENWTHLNDYVLADPEFFKSSKIDLLFGSDVLPELLLPELIPLADKLMPVMQKTTLGWILFGKAPIVSESNQVRSFMQTVDVETQLRKFWELEETPFKPFQRAGDIECENHFIANTERMIDGRYQVSLPFKGNVPPVFGDSYQGALRRFHGLERRFDANKQLRDQYTACIEEYIQLGHMSEVEKDKLPENLHYFLPHLAVIKESSSTTKLRVMFDASFKTSSGVSLNDAMLVGPALQQNICDIILRLELCGAFTLAKLLDHATQVFGNKNIKRFAWTDSTITLSWIRASPNKWETFVRNRVGEIQRLTPVKIWNHIPTQLNPADLVSRDVLPSALLDNPLWWNGPEFLRNAWDFQYPTKPIIQVHHIGKVLPPINELMYGTSEINKLIRIVAMILRFTNNSKKYIPNWKLGPISPKELGDAAIVLVKIAQLEMFPDGILKSRGMASLNPFVDSDGIIRIGGRLKNANLSYDQQHPIILVPSHHFTNLILHEAHEKTLHGGIQLMMGYLRKKYWIFQTKGAVKQYVHKYTICYRYKTKPAYQLMGELPAPRVTASRPLSHSGIDYAGSISIQAWKGRKQVYFAYFNKKKRNQTNNLIFLSKSYKKNINNCSFHTKNAKTN